MSEEELFEEGIPEPPEDFPEDEEAKPKKKKKSIEDELFGDDEEEEEKPKKKKDELDEIFEQDKGSGEDIYATADFERYDDGVAD